MPKKQKTVVVTYYSDDWHKAEPFSSTDTRASFEYWHTNGLAHGVDMYRASILWYDEKKRHFTKGWLFRDGVWKKVKKPIVPDLILDKVTSKRDYQLHGLKLRIAEHTKTFNHPNFRALFDNKLSQYMFFSEHMPPSFMVHNKQALKSSIDKIKTGRAVLKPLYGSGGFGILIDTKEKLVKKRISYPVLLQEFVDGSDGIPGNKNKALADLRIVFVNHKPTYALSRIAKKDSLFTNFHQGAHAEIIPINKIPATVRVMIKKIQHTLSAFPECHYSLDFLFTKKGKPLLMEMNTTPGFCLLHILGSEQIKKRDMLSVLSLLS